MDDTLSLIIFSGTDDKLTAAAVLAAGAAAMDRKVNVLLQYWGLDAFRVDRIRKDHGVATEAGPEGQALIARAAERELTVHRALDGCQFRVSSDKGVVRLAGRVRHELQKDVAIALLRTIDGVQSVESTLTKF